MSEARYFVPDHASLTEVYSKDDLRSLIQGGQLSRSDIVLDDQTGMAHLLGDLLSTAHREARVEAVRPAVSLADLPSRETEFRAHTPLPRTESQLRGEGELMDDEYSGAEEAFDPSRPDPEEEEPVEGEAAQGERLLYHGHPSWMAYPRSVLALFAFGGAAWLFHRLHAEFAWVIVSGALAVLPLLFVALDRTTTTYFITDRRVEVEFGIMGRSTKEVRIADIRVIDVIQRGYEAVVGIGTVKFDSAAGPSSEVEFHHVRRPHDLKHAVRELQG